MVDKRAAPQERAATAALGERYDLGRLPAN
jgi:hypothetical protein